MNIKLLNEHRLEFLSLKGAAQACQSLHLSKRHIVGNHMPRLKCLFYFFRCVINILQLFQREIQTWQADRAIRWATDQWKTRLVQSGRT